MTKEIKQAYKTLDIPYNSTLDEVYTRQKVLIKISRAKAVKTNKPCADKLNKISRATALIVNFIQTNGVPKQNSTKYEVKFSDVKNAIFVLFLMLAVAVVSALAILQ